MISIEYEPISKEKEKAFFLMLKANPDLLQVKFVNDKLLLHYGRFVLGVAMKYARKYSFGVEEIFGQFWIQTKEAVLMFNPENGTRFISFMVFYLHKALKKVVYERAGVKNDHWAGKYTLCSLEGSKNDEEAGALIDTIADKSPDFSELSINRATAQKLLSCCNDRERLILENLAKEINTTNQALNLSRERIRTIKNAAIERIRKKLETHGE